MKSRLLLALGWTGKLALGVAAAVVAIAMLGVAAPPSALTQTSEPTIPSPEVTAERAAEQALPRKAIAFEPTHFDRYVGYYQLGPTAIRTVTRDGSHFLARLTGQVEVEWFPESETKFFATVVPAQISFDTDASGRVTELVLATKGGWSNMPRGLTKQQQPVSRPQ